MTETNFDDLFFFTLLGIRYDDVRKKIKNGQNFSVIFGHLTDINFEKKTTSSQLLLSLNNGHKVIWVSHRQTVYYDLDVFSI